ncbi:sensor histidine kinase [Paenibacillus silviterrae]|uniref:sensor histidine kinase n=1 Tax=Paenibacillus silviterrae TaxID=3242194 RepID=UPI002542AD36|nr:sensor histidine kinase [Paenibacillus chinjuensis]
MLERREWHWVDWALFSVYTGLTGLMILMLFTQEERMGSPDPGPFLLLILACYALPLLCWRPRFIHSDGFAFLLLFSSGIPAVYYSYLNKAGIGLILLPTIIVGYLAKKRTLVWTLPVYLIAIPITINMAADKMQPTDIVSRMFDYCLMYGIGYALQRIKQTNEQMKSLLEVNRKHAERIEQQNRTLEQYAKQVERITLLEERNRMARELHDTVGHTFTSVIMGMDAVSYLVEQAPEKAKGKLEVLRGVMRGGLDEVRRSIHQIAPDGADDFLLEQLKRLAEEFALHTGTKVDVTEEGPEPELSGHAKLTLVRCLQEALTNAKRHGQARHVKVGLRHEPLCTVLTIEDDGVGMPQVALGFGLNAMKERLQALGGGISVSSQVGKGTSVHCTVPHNETTSLQEAL